MRKSEPVVFNFLSIRALIFCAETVSQWIRNSLLSHPINSQHWWKANKQTSINEYVETDMVSLPQQVRI